MFFVVIEGSAGLLSKCANSTKTGVLNGHRNYTTDKVQNFHHFNGYYLVKPTSLSTEAKTVQQRSLQKSALQRDISVYRQL